MSIRETILKRIKDLRKGEEEVCFGHNVKQEEKLSDFRMNVMQILLELVKIDASSIENLRKVGDDLVKFRGVISAEVRGSKPFANFFFGLKIERLFRPKKHGMTDLTTI